MVTGNLQWPVLFAAFASTAGPWFFRKRLIGPPWMKAMLSGLLISLTLSARHERVFAALLIPITLLGFYRMLEEGGISIVIIMPVIPIILTILITALLQTKFVMLALPILVPAATFYLLLWGAVIVAQNTIALWHAFYTAEILYVAQYSLPRATSVSGDPVMFWLVVSGSAVLTATVMK